MTSCICWQLWWRITEETKNVLFSGSGKPLVSGWKWSGNSPVLPLCTSCTNSLTLDCSRKQVSPPPTSTFPHSRPTNKQFCIKGKCNVGIYKWYMWYGKPESEGCLEWPLAYTSPSDIRKNFVSCENESEFCNSEIWHNSCAEFLLWPVTLWYIFKMDTFLEVWLAPLWNVLVTEEFVVLCKVFYYIIATIFP
jgi:hypothetical protein